MSCNTVDATAATSTPQDFQCAHRSDLFLCVVARGEASTHVSARAFQDEASDSLDVLKKNVLDMVDVNLIIYVMLYIYTSYRVSSNPSSKLRLKDQKR